MYKRAGWIFALCFCTTVLFLTSCKGKKEQQAPGPAAAKQTVLARLSNGDVVTWEDLDNTYHVDRMRQRFDEEQIRRLIDNLVKQHVIYLDSLEKGYDKDPEYVDQINRTKMQLLSRIAMRKLNEQRTEVNEQDMRAYYDAHPDMFNVLKLKYLMFSLSRYENDRAKAEAAANEALKAVKKGMTFEEAALKFLQRDRPFSLSLRKGQDSFFGKDFDDAAWKMNNNEIGGIMETPQGFVIAQVVEKGSQAYDEAKSYIRTTLNRDKSTKKVDDYYASLMKKYNVKLDEAAIKTKLSESNAQPPGTGTGSFNPPPPGSPGAPGGLPMPGATPPGTPTPQATPPSPPPPPSHPQPPPPPPPSPPTGHP